MSEEIKNAVKETYTKVVTEHADCGCGPSCCAPDAGFSATYTSLPGYEAAADYGLGCGLPTQHAKLQPGHTVLDLGSGAGNDAFVARSIVGETGTVIGVDMTPIMVEKARENTQRLGFTNVAFHLGEIEDLPVAAGTVDVAISNCVMNLVPNKLKAYQEVHRVLSGSGHFCISDIVLAGDLPEGIRKSAEMYAGCISGALEKEQYLKTIAEAGFSGIQVVKEREILLPDSLLLQHLSPAEVIDYRKSGGGVLSITVVGHK